MFTLSTPSWSPELLFKNPNYSQATMLERPHGQAVRSQREMPDEHSAIQVVPGVRDVSKDASSHGILPS